MVRTHRTDRPLRVDRRQELHILVRSYVIHQSIYLTQKGLFARFFERAAFSNIDITESWKISCYCTSTIVNSSRTLLSCCDVDFNTLWFWVTVQVINIYITSARWRRSPLPIIHILSLITIDRVWKLLIVFRLIVYDVYFQRWSKRLCNCAFSAFFSCVQRFICGSDYPFPLSSAWSCSSSSHFVIFPLENYSSLKSCNSTRRRRSRVVRHYQSRLFFKRGKTSGTKNRIYVLLRRQMTSGWFFLFFLVPRLICRKARKQY